MNLPTDHVDHARVPEIPSGTPRRTRRPSGEPPPLPRHLKTSGVGWLLATAVLVGAALLVFGRGVHGVAVGVTVVDDAVVGWLQDLGAPGSVDLFRVLAWPSSWTFLNAVGPALLVTLLALRRFRHLVVALMAFTALQVVGGIMLAT